MAIPTSPVSATSTSRHSPRSRPGSGGSSRPRALWRWIGGRATWTTRQASPPTPSLLFEHDLFGKPVPTHRVVARGHAFPDHALIVNNYGQKIHLCINFAIIGQIRCRNVARDASEIAP